MFKKRDCVLLEVHSVELVLDLGNTALKAGIFLEGKFSHAERIPLEEAPGYVNSLSRNYTFDNCIFSSVSSKKDDFDWPKDTNILDFNSKTPVPVKNGYGSPLTLGRDRLANACFAVSSFPGQNVLIIDAGTCLKFDLVTADGTYRGGSISPGLGMRYKAMHTFTGRLPLLSTGAAKTVIGTNTEESMRSGAFMGMVFELKGTMQWYLEKYPDIKFCITGGDASLLAEDLNFPIFADPYLTLKGLYSILKHNA